MVLWNSIYTGKLSLANYYAPNLWHAHEMLAGYSVAVIAGFLLTAVKNWTSKATLTGDALAGLCLLWLYGRILPFYEGLLPDGLIAFVDFAFLPVLAYHISKPILQTKYYQGLVFVGILLILSVANALVHIEQLGGAHSAWQGLQLMVATIIVLILIIAGRVLPFFTEHGLTGVLIIRNPLADKVAIGSAVLLFVLQLMDVTGTSLAIVAASAAIANGYRVLGWFVQKVYYVPLLWVLYSGYCWIIIGFILMSLSAYNLVPAALAMHALTLGGIGLLTLGMMARVSLGHTGYALKAANAIVLAFALLNIAALIRVFLPIIFPQWYDSLIYFTTLTWLAAFSLFVFIYTPILTSPRIDGLDG
jgi:uncharacterized protein involved in response to NO